MGRKLICDQLRATSSFWMGLFKTRDKKALSTFIFDPGLSDSRLLWLNIVLLYFDRVGLK